MQAKQPGVRQTHVPLIAAATGAILLVPLVAMRFTDEVVWTVGDFVVAGALLFGSGMMFDLIASRATTTAYRAAIGVAVGAALLLVWVNLAVGIIGTENNDANALYLGVLVIGATGAAMARLRAQGMARTMFAMAIAQATVPLIALIGGGLDVEPVDAFTRTLDANAMFVVLFAASAMLFRRAAALPH
jgi:hypothetical protein